LFRLVTKLLGLNKFAVNDEDCQSNTGIKFLKILNVTKSLKRIFFSFLALHLACIHGHYEIVSTLISGDANIVARLVFSKY